MRNRELCWIGILLLAAGCPDSQDLADAGARPDSGSRPDLSCFANPTTHIEIINACTPAQALDKTPVLPLLRPDGTLPPLP